MSKKSNQIAVEIFAALSDRTRLSLVTELTASPRSATVLAGSRAVTRQAIVKHLQVLENAGLVVRTKHGRDVLYALDLQRLAYAKLFLEETSAKWDSAIRRLQKFVES